MNKTLEKIIKLAKEWSEFSVEAHAWESMTYENDSLSTRCYFQDNPDYRSVTFGEFRVGLLDMPVIYTPSSLLDKKELSNILFQYSNYLKTLKDDYQKKDKEEKEQEKKEKIKALKKQLEELENEILK
jgi:hypothetical protein